MQKFSRRIKSVSLLAILLVLSALLNADTQAQMENSVEIQLEHLVDRTDVFIFQSVTGTRRRIYSAQPGTIPDHLVTVSPDGKYVALVEIFFESTSTARSVNHNEFVPDVSQQSLETYSSSDIGLRHIVLIDLTNDKSRILVEPTDVGMPTSPFWAPDSSSLAYIWNKSTTGTVELWVAEIATGQLKTIVTEKNFWTTLINGKTNSAAWENGDTIQFLDERNGKILQVRLDGTLTELTSKENIVLEHSALIIDSQIYAMPSMSPTYSGMVKPVAVRDYNDTCGDGYTALYPDYGGCVLGNDGNPLTGPHPAVDIAGGSFAIGCGTPVVAVCDGVILAAQVWANYPGNGVCAVNSDSGIPNIFGSYVLLRCDIPDVGNPYSGRIFVTYAHLSSIEPGLDYGVSVSKGDKLGEIGSTGNSGGPHLHFQMEKDNQPNHPYWWNNESDINTYTWNPMYFIQAHPENWDSIPPTINFTTPTRNLWYNTDQTFFWNITDNFSGVDYFKWAWDDNTPDTQVTGGSGSTTLSAAGQGQHTLYVQAWDKAGNASAVASPGWFGYDTTVPTVTLLINNGAITTGQTTVALDLTYGDTGSGVVEARASNNGLNWGNWMPIATSIPWAIPALDLTTLPVHVQVRDGAGNLSAVVSDMIALDLYPPAPHSASYRLCSTVIDTGGGAWVTSTTYTLVSSIGQPCNSGATGYTSTDFAASEGFLADMDGCRAITRPAPRGFDIQQWVVAASGNTRSSSGYRLSDTTGEAVVSGAQPMRSMRYQLSGGFWGQAVPLACPAPLTGARITGPTTSTVGATLAFNAILTPTNATTPLAITWTPTPQSGQGTSTAMYQWTTAGTKTVTVTVQNCGGVITATQTIVISTSPTCPVPLVGIEINGPLNFTETLHIGTDYLFVATLIPLNATAPFTYTWLPTPISGQGTTDAIYRWNEPNTYTITLMAENCSGVPVQAQRTITVHSMQHVVYLPLVLRNQ